MNLTAPAFRIPFNPYTENPRWVRCRVAIGREPKAREYVPWMSRCWIEFCREHGVKDQDAALAKFVAKEALHDAFDAWQDEAVASGRLPDLGPPFGTHE